MPTQIQFGTNWVQVKGSIFYLTPHALRVVKEFYEEAKADNIKVDIEYLAKAFELLKPESEAEAKKFIDILNEIYPETKEIIDRIYTNKNAYNTVREL
ncbi:hypothetical protein [Saccharolobus islandicus]|nr:hypothetical protein [Sulfolobus islandicus]